MRVPVFTLSYKYDGSRYNGAVQVPQSLTMSWVDQFERTLTRHECPIVIMDALEKHGSRKEPTGTMSIYLTSL